MILSQGQQQNIEQSKPQGELTKQIDATTINTNSYFKLLLRKNVHQSKNNKNYNNK